MLPMKKLKVLRHPRCFIGSGIPRMMLQFSGQSWGPPRIVSYVLLVFLTKLELSVDFCFRSLVLDMWIVEPVLANLDSLDPQRWWYWSSSIQGCWFVYSANGLKYFIEIALAVPLQWVEALAIGSPRHRRIQELGISTTLWTIYSVLGMRSWSLSIS